MNSEKLPLKLFRSVFAACLLALVVTWAGGWRAWAGPALIGTFASLALCFMSHPALKGFAFTVWVFAFVATAMVYPAAFTTWFRFDLSGLIVPLLQIIMFGMGTTLNPADFGRVLKTPWPILVGFVLQYSVMPLLGLALATAGGFEPEVAAGLILVGSCPGGVASNVMTYLAGGDVALSVTMTSCSTLASWLATPALMKLLAGRTIEVHFLEMMFSIINMIIVPIIAGFVANRILWARRDALRRAMSLLLIGAGCMGSAIIIGFLPPLGGLGKNGIVVGLLLVGAVTWAQLVIGAWRKVTTNWMDRVLPVVSMVAICCIVAIITARSAEKLMTIGLSLIAATMLHNLIGYSLGYGLARLARLKETACRTVAIEVGMQNSGMGSALAMSVLHSPSAALAPVIFSAWQNISGSILATWWRRRPVRGTIVLRPLSATADEPGAGKTPAN